MISELSWENVITEINDMEELGSYEKEKTRRAFSWLRQEFGEDFFFTAFVGYPSKNYHPLCTYFMNRAPWTRKWLTNFADSLIDIKNESN